MEIQKHSLHSSVSTPDSIANVTDIKTFRSEQKLYRVTGFIIQFIKNLRRSQNKSSIVSINYVTIEELRNAKLLLLLKANQRELEDAEEFKNIESCFCLFKSKGRLLRSKGRIGNSLLIQMLRSYLYKIFSKMCGGDSFSAKFISIFRNNRL